MGKRRLVAWGLAGVFVGVLAACDDQESQTGDDDDDFGGTGAATGVGTGTDPGTGQQTGLETDTGTGTFTGTGSGCPEGDPKLCGIVDAHNAVRANVAPPANPPLPPLTWNPAAAAVAAEWASGCVFGHNPELGQLMLGENVFMTSGTATPEQVVGLWASEVADYDYASNSCSDVCGHYTQIVWRDTTSVGCGVATCPQGEIWVCDYSPPGNYVGQKPY
jgi:pathogenesis-related protein 1